MVFKENTLCVNRGLRLVIPLIILKVVKMSTAISETINTYNQKTVNNINSSDDCFSVSVYLNNTNTNNTNTKPSVTDVRSKAQYLSDKLNNPSRFLYYCKVVWRLPEHQIDLCLEQALNGNNPANYFSWLTKRAIGK